MFIPLRLIPVLDLMAGQVVRAREGRRDEYRPLTDSVLSRSSRPADVLDGLLRLYPFRQCYIADLDAILRRGDHRREIALLRAAHPELEFWVDAGLRDGVAIAAWPPESGRPVLGSECLDAAVKVAAVNGILSLDFRGDDFLGPSELLAETGFWPHEVIVMTLQRVGGGKGPDLERLTTLRARAPEKRYFAAGGVRGPADLVALARVGAAGVLLASALHDGRLKPADLAAWHDPGPGDAETAARATGPGRDR